jgi:hypothetical protein
VTQVALAGSVQLPGVCEQLENKLAHRPEHPIPRRSPRRLDHLHQRLVQQSRDCADGLHGRVLTWMLNARGARRSCLGLVKVLLTRLARDRVPAAEKRAYFTALIASAYLATSAGSRTLPPILGARPARCAVPTT